MKSFIVLSMCIAMAYAGAQPYAFGYQTADGQSRQESGVGGAVQGSYSYIDANGDPRQVNYVADANGFRASGDVSVDRRTAVAAAQLAAIAPKGTVSNPIIGGPAIAGYAAAPYASFGAPFASYNSLAAPIARYGVPIAPYAASPYAVIGARGYQVNTPTHQIYAQI